MCLYMPTKTTADEAIKSFLSYYRWVFPEASVTVKMHMLEEHLVPFLREWRGIGFGLMAEQGAESIHKEFNNLMHRFVNIPDRVERLRCVLREHHLRCCPVNRDAKPQPKKRKSVCRRVTCILPTLSSSI